MADSIYSSASSAAVGLITKQGVPHMLCMHPELERAPRLQPPLQQGCTNPTNGSSSCYVLMTCLPVHTALRAPACSALIVSVHLMHQRCSDSGVQRGFKALHIFHIVMRPSRLFVSLTFMHLPVS